MKKVLLLILLVIPMVFTTCEKKSDKEACKDIKRIPGFPTSKDIEFGVQLDNSILSEPAKYPVLDRTQYSEVYGYVQDMIDDVLASSYICHTTEFEWKLTIINDSVLNAFAAPGGYIYVYTGLMKYLEDASHLAGVIGHEIAHADRRHSINQMAKAYSIDLLLSLILGTDASKVAEIAASLASGALSLKFSRDDEEESDIYSVRYLSETNYDPRGVAGFFEKLQEEGDGAKIPTFLSTHPADDDRIKTIQDEWEALGQPNEDVGPLEDEHKAIIDLLP